MTMTGIPIDKIDNIRKCGIKALLIRCVEKKNIHVHELLYKNVVIVTKRYYYH